ncbi:hypothetical protein BDV59DRAFT_196084 [Aspergillus ambiguus]|uniref:uncharacterized protein n=1 Tax=Aspergillus ambiguus TaxID=176160 RepID=UPI003CCDC9AF
MTTQYIHQEEPEHPDGGYSAGQLTAASKPLAYHQAAYFQTSSENNTSVQQGCYNDSSSQYEKEVACPESNINFYGVEDYKWNAKPIRFKPCAIPQLNKLWWGGPNANPFVRAWAPPLAQHGISKGEFLRFIDGLNEAWLINPSLNYFSMATGLTGLALTFEPHIGSAFGATSLAATAAAAVVTMQRTKSYLKTWNETLFNPVGLQARILKTDSLMPVIGYKGGNAWERYEHNIQGSQEVEIGPNNDTKDRSPEKIQSDIHKILQRKLEPIGSYVMPLTFDAGPSVEMDGVMKKWGATEGNRIEKLQLKMMRHGEKKKAEECQKEHQTAENLRTQIQKLTNLGEKESVIANLKQKLEHVEKNIGKRYDKKIKKSGKEAERVRWIVITSLEDASVERLGYVED